MAQSTYGFIGLSRLLSAILIVVISVFAPVSGWAADIHFNDLYTKGTELSAKAKSLNGKEVEIVGYMAPPLKAKAKFFVLTKMPLAVCPFCDSEVDWPNDIIFVRSPVEINAYPFNSPIRVIGTFQSGFEKDAETGFVSFIRLVDAQYEPM